MKSRRWLLILSFFMSLGFVFAFPSREQGQQTRQAQQPNFPVKEREQSIAAPFTKGVNFSAWFETADARSIPFTRYREQDFIDVKNMGADVIRVPIRMHDMTSGAPDYTLDPLLLRFLDTAVDWAEKHGLYIILDNHSFHPVNNTPNDIDKALLPVWAQMAQRYSRRSKYVVYEILNEPHGISDRRWAEVQGRAIETIRRHDQSHAIIVGGTDFNSVYKLSALPEYADSNLIYTFHYYDPFLFTHQGASWTGAPSLLPLAGVPFPYDRARMPQTPASLRGSWIEGALREYQTAASAAKMVEPLDTAAAFSQKRGVPVFCGEFGVLLDKSPAADRVRWYEFAAAELDKRNIARASWDYYGGFGIFNFSGKGDFNSDLNTAVVRAMGFTPPLQVPKRQTQLTTGFVLYDDYPNRLFDAGFWGKEVDLSYYDENSADGDFAIRWANAGLYESLFFSFSGGGDLSRVASAFSLEFKARTDKPVKFDVRFINIENENAVPWRMSFTVDEKTLPPDGRWHTIRIPLNSMREHGAWVSAAEKWLEPTGEFRWDRIDRLEFAAEHMSMKGIRLYLDSIKVTR